MSVELTRPRINHLAFTVSPDVFKEDRRVRISRFLSECFGFEETDPGEQFRDRVLSFQWGPDKSLHDPDQLYLVFISHERPYQANPGHMGDHFGLTLSSLDEYRNVLENAKHRASEDRELEVSDIDEVPSEGGTLHRFYVRLATPLACEVQFFEKGARQSDRHEPEAVADKL